MLSNVSTCAEQGFAGDGKQPPLVPRFGYFPRLKPSVGRQGRGRQTRRGTSPGQEVLPLLRALPSVGRRSTSACRLPAAQRAFLHAKGRQSAGRATWCGLRDCWARPPVPHGTRAPVSQGRSPPALVVHTRAASAGGAPRAPGLASHLRRAPGRGRARAGSRSEWSSWVAPDGPRRVGGGRGGVPPHPAPT